MSLFGKLFGKKEKPPQPQTPQRVYIDTPFGQFTDYYEQYNNPSCCNVFDWYEDDGEPLEVTVFYDDPVTKTADKGFAALGRFLADKANVDYRVKMAALDALADSEGFIPDENGMLTSKSLFLDGMRIEYIEIDREGNSEFGIYECRAQDVRMVKVTITDKGTFEVKVSRYGEEEW